MAPKMPKEHADFRRHQILMAAWECFAEKGYHETTMRDISKAMDLSTGIIYTYFKGKEEVLDALHEWSMEQKSALFVRLAQQDSAKDAILELLSQFFECIPQEECRKNARSDISMWSQALKRENIRKKLIFQLEYLLENISGFARRGVKSGELHSHVDPVALAGLIVAIIIGLQVQSALAGELFTSSYYENVKKILFGSIWRNPEGDSGA